MLVGYTAFVGERYARMGIRPGCGYGFNRFAMGHNGGSNGATRMVGARSSSCTPGGYETTPSDEELLHRVREDEGALEELYRRWGRRVAGLARAAGVAEGDQADVVQSVFTELWRHAGRFDPERGTAETWILTLTRRRVIDALRIRRAVQAGTGVQISYGPASASEAAVEDRAWLYASLAELSQRERDLLQLEYWGGFTQGEVARMWKVPLGTLKTWNRRALGKLRAVMIDTDAGGGR